MTLVRELGCGSDLGDRCRGVSQLLERTREPYPPDKLTERASHARSKLAREMYRVNAGGGGHRFQTELAGVQVVRDLDSRPQPARRSLPAHAMATIAQDFRGQRLNHQV